MSILIKHRSRNATNLFYDTLKIVLLLLVLLLFNKPFLYAQSNYQYDSDGRLTADLSEGIVKIEWNRSNKVTHIQRADTSHMPDLEFIYDAHNNRVAKLVKPRHGSGLLPESNWTYTYYIYNGRNHSVATYTRLYTAIDNSTYNEQFKIGELTIEADKRYGLYTLSEEILVNYFFNAEFERAGKFFSRQEKEVVVQPPATYLIKHSRGSKNYQVENHQENVLCVVSDRKVTNNTSPAYATTDVLSAVDYYPFGMEIPGRIYTSVPYRYGFNGKEKDNEPKGEGNSVDFGARFYDPRLGRFLSLDAMANQYPSQTPYHYSLNSPLMFRDPDGNRAKYTVIRKEGGGGTIVIAANIIVVGADKKRKISQIKEGVSHFYKERSYVDGKTGEEFTIKFDIKVLDLTELHRKVAEEDNIIVIQNRRGRSERSHADPRYRYINLTVEDQTQHVAQVASHEIGHLIGLEDRYFENDPSFKKQANAKHTARSLADIKSGKIKTDLMGASPQKDIKSISLNRVHYNNLGRYILENAGLRDNLPSQRVERTGYITYSTDIDGHGKLIGGMLSEKDEINRRIGIGAGLAARQSYQADAARRAQQKSEAKP